jgi:probable HAF family extracellular repeat protein
MDMARLVIAILVVTVGFIVPGRTFGQASAYTVLELPAAIGDRVPYRLNNLGNIAGRAYKPLSVGTQATIWSYGSLQSILLGTLPGGDYSFASDINDAGEVVGASNTGSSMVPFIWTAGGGMQRGPMLPGDNGGQALGVNKYGHVVGYSSGLNGVRAFIWTQSNGIRSLGVLLGGSYSRARGLNDLDEVVGTSASSAGDRAVLWAASGNRNLRNLGTLPGDTSSEATAINNAGDVVGYSKGPKGMRAFLWTGAAGMKDLGVLSGGNNSRALDVNGLGVVVGTSTSSSGDRAFIWTQGGGMKDLNATITPNLGVLLVEAHAINDKGEIVVMGADGNSQGSQHVCAPAPKSTFLLIPAASH